MLQKFKNTSYVFILCLFGLTILTVSPVSASDFGDRLTKCDNKKVGCYKKLVSEKSIKISHDFFISTDKQKLKNLSNINNANYRLFLGHAGWTEGQLENEIANGDWVVQETSIDFIFNSLYHLNQDKAQFYFFQ